ncbi:MAG: DUF5716 family protein [Defluviitaleaceae bacterium]|nr:DUF5716 family protein [Defluviitaleaceae bacterium]
MSWKKYREHFKLHRMDEDHFVLGLDFGNATSAIAYFDVIRENAEILDISGGYGKPAAPTALQYIAASKEWIFGEYAILNANGQDSLLTGFAENLGGGAYLDIGDGNRSVVDIAAIYIEELIANCRSINPKAVVSGIVAVVPDFVASEAKTALSAAVAKAGYENLLIDLVEERQAVFAFCHHNKIAANKLMWLDFGDRGLRGGLYEIKDDYNTIECLAADFNEELGSAFIDREIYNLLAGFYCRTQKTQLDELSKTEQEQILTFAYGHKDVLLNNDGKDTRIYYNFVYPPFSEVVSASRIAGMAWAWENGLEDFVNRLLGNHFTDDITVICTGGGFEMPWAKKKIAQIFDTKQLYLQKNPKGILAQGATLYAAQKLELLRSPKFEIADGHKTQVDIGISITQGGKQRFYAIIERGSWLWQKPKTTYIIPTGENAEIELLTRDETGRISPLGIAKFKSMPKRPQGTTRIALDLEPTDNDRYTVKIKDLGFGEIYPATGLVERFDMRIV